MNQMQFKISPSTETTLKSLIAFAGMLTLAGFLGSFVAGSAGVYVSLGLTATMSFATLWFCREIVTWLMNAKEVKPNEKPEGFDLHKMVDGLYQHPKINLSTKPKICIIHSDKLNAFATGRNKNHTAIAITTGLLKKAKQKANGDMAKATRWIEAVWCHELGHIIHHDVATKSAMTILASSVRILSESLYNQRRTNEKQKKYSNKEKVKEASLAQTIAEYLLFYWIVPFTATLMSLCLSRAREFAADDMAKQCGRAEDLAQAFEQLLQNESPCHKHTHSTKDNVDALGAMLCLNLDPKGDDARANALNDKNIGWFKWMELSVDGWLSTHPPIQQRIDRLRDGDEAKKVSAARAA